MTAPGAATLPEALTILAEAAEVGGEGGLLGGPVGALIGVGLGLTAGGLIILSLEHANDDHSASKPGALEECPFSAAEEADEDIGCFKSPPHVALREFERNVKMAEDEINESSPDDFLDRLEQLDKKGARAIRNEPKNKEALQDAWENWKELLKNDMPQLMPHLADLLLEDFPEARLTPQEASASVEREWGGDKPKSFMTWRIGATSAEAVLPIRSVDQLI